MSRTKTTGSFKKGEGGRRPGVPNKTTKEARELFVRIMDGEIENIKSALEKIRIKDPAKYIDALSKLFQYTMPKQMDLTSDGDKITNIKVTYVDKLNRDNGE